MPGRAFSITAGVAGRRRVFDDLAFGYRCVEYLAGVRCRTGHGVLAYCLMPDHVHLLLATGQAGSIVDFVGRWKSLCVRNWSHYPEQGSFWQRGFYDHALRQEEDLRKVGEYILANPVRAGLVERAVDYPLSGSLEWDL